MKLFYLIPCFLAMLSCIVCSPNPLSCNNLCATPMNWAPPSLGLCGQNGKNYYNHLCDSAFKSFGMCLINSKFIITNVGISYPGDCGCPNYCYNTTMQGNCTGTCQCESGWTGADCSQLTMENTCSGHGSVVDIAGILNCNCNGEYALSDCSASVVSLPPIIQTISPAQQYSSWDDYGNNNPIFNESTIAVMHLTMAPSDFAFLLNPANIESDTYVNASMWFDNGATLQTMNNIGIRLQGGASRGYVKKSWKLKFDEFEDQKWAQQKKLGVKSLEQDPSGIKGSLCFSLLYSLNLPAQRASYAQVFINGQGMGGFIMEEAIDDQFLKSRFGNDDGALFKCSSPLAYLGSDPQLYNTSEIVPKTDLADTEIGFSLIRDLIFIINATTDEEFASALPTVLDVDSYTRSLAFEVLTGNWDGLWNSNNYYLYWNPEVGVFQYIRHDMDMTFGAVEPYYPMKTAPVYTWGDGGSGYRLINRVLAVQPFRQMFTDYCYQLIDAYYNLEGEYVQRMEALNRQIAPLMKRDNWRTTDFGWTFSEFEEMPDKGLTRPPGGFFEKHNFEDIHFMGLKEFMEARIQSALQQLDPPSK